MAIDDTEARRIACLWQSGQGSPLYDFCSTGAILAEPDEGSYGATLKEVFECLARTPRGPQRWQLRKLEAYVLHHGPRGPVDGWSRMPWGES